jgi:hypothetical protein
VPSLLALRLASTVQRLPPRSEACPLSLRPVARALAGAGGAIPIVAAPHPAVARAALIAAKGARALVALALPAGAAPEPWFAALAEAADELAPGLPFVACGDVVVASDGDGAIDAAWTEARRLVEAGLTHLAVDVSAVTPARRARTAARVAAAAAERELAVECPLPAGATGQDEAVAYLEEFEGSGARADLVSVRCAAPGDAAAAAAEAQALGALAAALGRPLVRRGPLPDAALAAVRSARPLAVEDGGRALDAGASAARGASGPDGTPGVAAGRLEAFAYAEVGALLDALGAAGTARAVEAALGAGRR